MEIAGFIVEVLILLAVVAEGWISWIHYKNFLNKKERSNLKRKTTKLLKSVRK